MICRCCHRTIRASSICPTCHRCTSITCGCSCEMCEQCSVIAGKRVMHPHAPCTNCGRCKKCCGCRKRGAREGVFGPTHYVPNAHGIYLHNPINRAVSVEVELTNFKYLSDKRFNNFRYSMVRDSSVHGSEMEMVIGPMQGDQVVAGILELVEAMVEQRCTYDESCGYHVHVDIRDFSWWTIMNLVRVWEKFSPIAYKYLHPERVGNRNCLNFFQHPRWKSVDKLMQEARTTHDLKIWLHNLIFGDLRIDTAPSKLLGDELIRAKRSKYGVGGHSPGNLRYYDLNLFSYVYRGTVEFRSMHMTTDPLELVGWPLVCLGLVRIAESRSLKWIIEASPTTIMEALPVLAKQYLQQKGAIK